VAEDRVREYRVVWKREGCRKKVRTFATRRGASRQLARLGPEPWTAYGKGPDDLRCCKGYGCGCDGLTEREWAESLATEMPPLEFVRLESRPALPWKTVDA
jgi:hypothetical protein